MDRKDENWFLVTLGVVVVTVLCTLWASGFFSEQPVLINKVKIGIESQGNWTATYTNGKNIQQAVSGNGSMVIELERPALYADGNLIWTVSVNARMLGNDTNQLHVVIWAEQGNEDFTLASNSGQALRTEVQLAAAVTYWGRH